MLDMVRCGMKYLQYLLTNKNKVIYKTQKFIFNVNVNFFISLSYLVPIFINYIYGIYKYL